MGKLQEELADWVTDLRKNGEINDQELEQLETILGKPKNLNLVRKSVLATSEFSKQMDKLRQEHEEKIAAEDRFHQDVANWKTGAEAKLNRAIRERHELEAQIRALAESNNADPERDWNFKLSASSRGDEGSSDVGGTGVIRRRADGGSSEGDSETFDPRKLRDEIGAELRMVPRFNTMLADLQAEHLELFGKPLKGATQLLDRALKEKKPLRDLWEEEHKVSERRAEIERAKQTAHDKEVADEAVRKYVSDPEHAVNPSIIPTRTRSESGSPTLDKFYAKKKAEDMHPEERSVNAALQAFHTGKYREQAKSR
jgi:hypothetical protein